MQKRSDELGPELESRLGEPFDRVVHDPALRDRAAFDRHNAAELELAFRRYARVAAALIERGECDA